MTEWWRGKVHDQATHAAINAVHYPGTRQLCIDCDQPTGGAVFTHVEPVTADEVFDVLAGRANKDKNGHDAGYWFNQIIVNSNLAELPITVVAEIVRNAAAHNDGSHVQVRGYLESILSEEGLI